MQQPTRQPFFKQVSIALCAVLFLATAFCSYSFTTRRVLDNFWQAMGISKEAGTNNIKESFIRGYLLHYGASKVKNLAVADRVAVAQDLMAYTKTYMSSEAFLRDYQKMRNSAKPVPSEQKLKTKEELRKEKVDELEKSIRESEANLKNMSADMAKNLRPVIDMLKAQLKDYKDPKSQMIDLMYQGEVMNRQSDERYFQESMERWEKEFPTDPAQKIKDRLQHFVDLAATVDFNAELKTVGNKKKFVKAAYEGKSTEWKQVFRAGKDVITPAVAFAKQWISEIK